MEGHSPRRPRLGAVGLVAAGLVLIATPASAAGSPPANARLDAAPTQVACRGEDGYAAAFGGRRTFSWRPEFLAAAKARVHDDPALRRAHRALMARATAALAGPLYAVTDKRSAPPSGDKHDYMSIGPYWWPDPERPSGPYVRRDGVTNPLRDSDAYDAGRLGRMVEGVEALSLAYYFEDDPRFAAKAVALLRAWFLDPSTRMNPNASYAQGAPGRSAGRAEGVLDTFRFLRLIEAVGLLSPSGRLTAADQAGLERWFADYAGWMRESAAGRSERAASNNHSLWFDAQLLGYALFSRQPAIAREVVAATPERIRSQIEADGRMPAELGRTRAFHYSVFALEALATTADLGRCLGTDLWRYRSPDGRGMRAAVSWIAGYVGRENEFGYRELRPSETGDTFALLSQAALAYGDAALARKAELLAPANGASETSLIWPPAP